MGAEPGGAGERTPAQRVLNCLPWVPGSPGRRQRSRRRRRPRTSRRGTTTTSSRRPRRTRRRGASTTPRTPRRRRTRSVCRATPINPTTGSAGIRFDDVPSAARARGSVRGTARRAPRPRVPPPARAGVTLAKNPPIVGSASAPTQTQWPPALKAYVERCFESAPLERALAANRHRRAEAGHRGRHESGRALDHRLGREGAPLSAPGAGAPRAPPRPPRLSRARGGSRSWSRSVPPRVPRRSTGAREGTPRSCRRKKRFPATKRRSGAAARRGRRVAKEARKRRRRRKRPTENAIAKYVFRDRRQTARVGRVFFRWRTTPSSRNARDASGGSGTAPLKARRKPRRRRRRRGARGYRTCGSRRRRLRSSSRPTRLC